MKATGSSPLRRMTSLTMLLSLAIAACVAPAPAPTPVPTNTHSATPLPTSTFTPSPTPTFTVTPTPDPEQIAEALGLPFENGPSPYKHSYRIEGDNLMDYLAPIPAIAAQRVDGEWRAVTDDTVKYGALADSLDKPVVLYEEVYTEWMAGYSRVDTRDKAVKFNALFTGNMRVNDWLYPRRNEIIQDYQGEAVWRNPESKLVEKTWVSLFSPNMPGGIWFRFYDKTDSNGMRGVLLEEALKMYQPGQAWRVTLIYGNKGITPVANVCYEKVNVCTEETNRLMYLWKEQRENYQGLVSALGIENGYTAAVSPDMVIAPSSLMVYTESDPFAISP